jgi:hypothetical protein
MEVTRNVILDLLPLYLAGEVSNDTRALVEAYLAQDAELAQMAEEARGGSFTNDDIPIPITKESEMEALKDAKQLMFRRVVMVGVVVAFNMLCLLTAIGGNPGPVEMVVIMTGIVTVGLLVIGG